MIRLIAVLMLFSLPAMAGDYIFVDGNQVEVPDGFKVVMVPEGTPENCVAIEIVSMLPIVTAPENCCPMGELCFSGSTPCPPDPCNLDELVVSGTQCRP